MRVLVLSNFYPPAEIGGEELSAQAIVDGFRERGHRVRVLTSTHRRDSGGDDVHRVLKLEMPSVPFVAGLRAFFLRNWIIRRDSALVEKHVADFDPDVVLICAMWNLPREVPATAERLVGERVVYRFGSHWPTLPSQHDEYFRSPARWAPVGWIKRLLGAAVASRRRRHTPLTLARAICISESVRQVLAEHGVAPESTWIVSNGVDADAFDLRGGWAGRRSQEPLRLIYVGRLADGKGVETAIDALAVLVAAGADVTLTLAGEGPLRGSLEESSTRLAPGLVRFLGWQPFTELPACLAEHHVLLVPSTWPEPFGRVVLEGMAAGLVVVGSGAGGMGVALQEGLTGRIFTPGDPADLARVIGEIASDPTLGPDLVAGAMRVIRQQFSLAHMLDRYEGILRSATSVEADERSTQERPPVSASRPLVPGHRT